MSNIFFDIHRVILLRFSIEPSETIQDPTLFSAMRATYQTIVEDLLQKDASTDAALQEFQARNNSGLFLCRFHRCPRAEQGFSSTELRQQHEDSHAPRFQCTSSACGFFGCTYRTRALLKKHADRYHVETKISSIPSSLDTGKATTLLNSARKRRAASIEGQPASTLPFIKAQKDQDTVNEHKSGDESDGEIPHNADAVQSRTSYALKDYQMQRFLLQNGFMETLHPKTTSCN